MRNTVLQLPLSTAAFCSPLLPSNRAHFGALALNLAPFFDADPNPGNTIVGDPPPPPRSFTQSDVDEIVNERLARERTKITKKYEGVDADEYQRLKAEDAARKRKEAEEEKNYQAALRSQEEAFQQKEKTWKEQQESLLGEVKTERVRNRLLAAAGKHGAYDSQQVADLLEKRVKLGDDRQPVVLDERGEPAFKEGKALTVDALVSDYLDRNPHLVKSSGTAGAGSKGGASTDASGETMRRDTPDVKQARERLADIDERFKGRRPSAAELAERTKAVRALKDAEKAAKK